MNTPIVSFHRDIKDKTYYSDCAKVMIARCDKLGIDHFIKHRDYGPTWEDNVRAKATFLLEAYDTLKKPFLWVDVDCIIGEEPVEVDSFKGYVDFASVPNKPHRRFKVHDCVHYIGGSPLTRKVLVEWRNRCAQQVRDGVDKGYSHWEISKILGSGMFYPEIRFKYLPETYVEGPTIKLKVHPHGMRDDYTPFKDR